MKLMLLGILIIGSAIAQVPLPEKCPEVKVVPNFDTNKFLGKWYEAERYFNFYELAGKCVTATFSSNDNGTIGITYKQISAITGKESSMPVYAKQNTTEKAKLAVVFPATELPYWVLDTDYNSYTLLWSCKNIGSIASTRFAWILTREQNPLEAVLEKAYRALDKKNISRRLFIKTNQADCPANN